MLSLNNLNAAFERIAEAHYQINSYGFGDPLDINASGTIEYPMMWVIPKGVVTSQGQIEYSFTMLLMDLVHKGEGNKIEVWSDIVQIGQDIIAEFTNPDWAWTFVLPESNMQPFEERGDDEVAGYSMDFKIKDKYFRDRCAIPEGTITRSFQTTNISDNPTIIIFSGIMDDGSGSYSNSIVSIT